jgi:hypothetical protein
MLQHVVLTFPDSQLWMTSQALGAHGWNNWTPMGVSTFDTPHSVACANGNMVVSRFDVLRPFRISP